MNKRDVNLSAACGAWTYRETGEHCHDMCTGNVALPAPNDRCTCPCHRAVTDVTASDSGTGKVAR